MSIGQRYRCLLVYALPGSLGVGFLAVFLFSQQNVPSAGQQAAPLSEVEIYRRASTVVDSTRAELLQTYPDQLGDLELSEDQGELESILAKVGENVQRFFRDIPNTISKEQVRRERLRYDGAVEESVTQNYNYTAYLDKTGGWKEGRTDSSGRDIPPQQMTGMSFLTAGFASAVLYFEPKQQFGIRFRYLGRQRGEPYNYVIAFAQKPGVSDIVGDFTSILRPSPITMLFQGFVWVDPKSFQIIRLWQDLLAPRPDAFLSSAASDISYNEVRFQSVATPFWLPRQVVVTLHFASQRYRNRHRYSDYQVFTIAVEEKIVPPVVKK